MEMRIGNAVQVTGGGEEQRKLECIKNTAYLCFNTNAEQN
jgi:hypothetical protein